MLQPIWPERLTALLALTFAAIMATVLAVQLYCVDQRLLHGLHAARELRRALAGEPNARGTAAAGAPWMMTAVRSAGAGLGLTRLDVTATAPGPEIRIAATGRQVPLLQLVERIERHPRPMRFRRWSIMRAGTGLRLDGLLQAVPR